MKTSTTTKLKKNPTIELKMSGNCPLGTCGVWKQDFKRSESLCPFMDGLFPWPLSTVACTVADLTPVTLRIVCKTDNHIEIVDKTTFGRNVTEVSLFKNDNFFLKPTNSKHSYPKKKTTASPFEKLVL